MSGGSEARKIYKKYKALAEAQGWRVEDLTDGWSFVPPDKSKSKVTLHKTPSDHRWFLNFRAALRRSDLVE
jgi:hypothetical protein